jgi:hypothetical protein
MRRSTLLGSASVAFPSGLVINDISILNGERGPWASPPGKPQLDRDGNVVRDQAGKVRYAAVVEFTSREVRTRWSASIIEALREVHPEEFDQ